MKKDNVRYCDRCGVELTKRNNVCGFELCDKCNEVLGQQLAIKNDLSVPEVTALAEWTAKLTKASEDAYNKGYEDGMKAQAEHESLCKEEREISKEKAIEILEADSIASYSVEDILNARDMAIKAIKHEPRKGHWIKGYTFPDGAYWKCDKCNELIKVKFPMNYCNNCGADMREVEE